MNQVATQNDTALSKLVLKGDMSALTPNEKAQYYVQVCESVGLNPATQPFAYLTLSGKQVLYATKSAADQLRRIHGVSIRIADQSLDEGLFMVRVQATDRSGRADEDLGCVQIGHLQGEAKANAIHKAITKAKRRVTLSICGLGMLDESEVDGVQRYDQAATKPARSLDEAFGELPPPAAAPAPTQAPVEEEAHWPSDAFTMTVPQAIAGTTDGDLVISFPDPSTFVGGMIQAWKDEMAKENDPRSTMHDIAEIKRASIATIERLLPGEQLDRLNNGYAWCLKKLGAKLPKGGK